MQCLAVPSSSPVPVRLITPKKCTNYNYNFVSSTTRSRLSRSSACYPIQCTVVDSSNPIIDRRSGNYEPSIWSFDYIQSLTSQYEREPYRSRVKEIEGDVKRMLVEMENSLAQLELIDTLQRLGVSYRFENEISTILKEKYANVNNPNYNLYAIALEFRLLRQHGYAVPQEIFNHFKDETGKFKANIISDDIMGVLALYEASFYEKKGESILEEARIFTTKYLENYTIMISQEKKLMIDNDYDYDYNFEVVNHALELPLHWRTTRIEAKWFIDAYEKKQDMNPILLEFAKLDFNMIQSTHHDDLKHIFRWWRHTKLGEKLNFARDRLMECFLWKVGVRFEPKFSYFRKTTAKLYELITLIDDIYDVYGTLDELELFTKAVERWDVTMINELPEYMKMPFLVLHNTINEIVFEILRDKDISINIQYLKKTWIDMCRGFLQEAKWYYSGYTPTLEEYIENGWISVGAPVLIVHAYFSHSNNNKEIFECLEHSYYPTIIHHCAIILRLSNDLATSSEELERGDAPASIQCYMQEKNVSEKEAREHIKVLISEAWKEMNNSESDDGLIYPISLIEDAKNFARMGLFMYQHGDGHSSQDNRSKERISSLIIKPIPIDT
uniref:Terpene synthase 36 n=1 Tax=Cannabis sativa TaxID=3483 RepID=A0A7D5I2Z7_CANSA|nr:terpene synthase 36 [Cannabis sativa]